MTTPNVSLTDAGNTAITDAMVERAAEVLSDHDHLSPLWEELDENGKAGWRNLARVTLRAALRARPEAP